MTTTLGKQFADALIRIGIERAAAIKAQEDVRSKLEGSPKLRSWGITTVLIGSYARKTSIFPCHDVDVFIKLPQCPEQSPEVVFTEVQRVLMAAYGGRAKEQRRSMTVEGFEGGLSVDAVPAVPEGDHWKIPQTDRKQVGGRWVKDRWEDTNPERLTELSERLNQSGPRVAGDAAYIHTVRFMRQIRDAQLVSAKPGGLYFELLTYWAFQGGLGSSSHAELLAAALDRAATALESGRPVIEPAINKPYDPPPSAAELTNAARLFREMARQSAVALAQEECKAASLWRRVLGKNERGWCFPLPAGCDEQGNRIAAITANPDRGARGERGFA
jgi:hypothetical protein